jgi:hypothetical protein
MDNDEDRIANCLICTIADSLKVCKACAFNAGLPFRAVRQAESLSADHLLRIEEIRERFIVIMVTFYSEA